MGGNALSEAAWRDVLTLLTTARALRERGGHTGAARRAFERDLADAARAGGALAANVYLPLVAATAEGPLTFAQAGQSLDGRVAAAIGQTSFINGQGGLDHLHRLRALADAVVVGASTVAIDDPLLTTRRVAGDSPVRVVIDPRRRLGAHHRVFGGAAPSAIICRHGDGAEPQSPPDADIIAVAGAHDQPVCPHLAIAALRRRGLRTVFIEGGPATLSLFLAAGLIDRLHVIVAPMIIGSGPASFALPPLSTLDDAMRMDAVVHRLGDDVLFDCVPRRR